MTNPTHHIYSKFIIGGFMNHPLSQELNNDPRLIRLLATEARFIAKYNKYARNEDLRIARDIRAEIESFIWINNNSNKGK